MPLRKPKHQLVSVEVYEVFEELKDHLRTYHIESVADAADVHYSTLYHWIEDVTVAPRISTMVKVANAIGFDIRLVMNKSSQTKPRKSRRHLSVVK